MAAPASRAQAGSSSASAVLQIAAAPVPAPGGPGHGGPGRGRSAARRPAASQLDLRVSDAERSEVADQLSQHFGTGRLDEHEFSERLDQVMAATTYRDLAGVLQDLPGSVVPAASPVPPRPAPPGRPARPRRGRGLLRVALIALLVIFAAAAAHAVAWVLAPVLWIGVLIAIAVLAARARSRR
jgi:Flp pilus assembly protein TadB